MQGDDDLYRQYLYGDTVAYDELMLRYGDKLTLYLYGYLHSWEDAEDLMIEAFARIMAKRPKIGNGGFRAYLYKTARNLAARSHKISSRMQVFSLEDLKGEAADQILTEDRSWGKEKSEILQLCLERIDPAYSEALWLVYMEELSYAQAAAVMHVSEKKIDNLLARGKEHLRKELAKEGITDAYE